MINKGLKTILALTVGLALSSNSFATRPLDTSIAPMLQSVLPAVVNIRAQVKITDSAMHEMQKQKGGKDDKDDDMDQSPDGTFLSVASGVIIDAKNGYILTNSHPINDAQNIIVTLGDGHHYNAKVIGADKPTDIAVLQISAKNLTAIPIGDSSQLKIGDFVAAIGNPFGLSQSVTSGIVSALGRTNLGIENFENFIQTDTPINPGNSGGALINMQGQLVGINTAIFSPNRGSIGIGFAIPANMAKSIVQQLLQFGDVKRGLLGIGAQDITPELASAFNINSTKGAAVTQVWPDSPAQRAGVQVGDIITAVNSSDIKNANDVVNTVGFLRVDSKININVLRNNKSVTLNAILSDPKKLKDNIAKSDPFLYGVGLKEFSVLSPIHGNVQGVAVLGVDEDCNAWHADLRTGDIITSANQQKVKNIEDLKTLTAKADKILLLNVLRGPSAVFLVVNKES